MSPPSSMLFKRILYMSLLSDRQIKERCMKPSHYLKCGDTDNWRPVIAGVTHTQEQIDEWETRMYSRMIKASENGVLLRSWKPMISPFVPEAVRYKGTEVNYPITCAEDINAVKIISYGLSSFGYDIRMKKEGLKIFTNINSAIIDPMRMSPEAYKEPLIHYDEEFGLHYFILPPKSVALGHTVEHFCIPRDILVMCLGKSTYARVAMMPIVTPLEPEWEGELVLEIANLVELPMRIYLETGIAQLLFLQGNEPCEISYKDRGGKYQGQTGTQDAIV